MPIAEISPATPVIIVSYRNPSDVVACLKTLSRADAEPAFEIYVCENGGQESFQSLVEAATSETGPCMVSGRKEALTTPRLKSSIVLSLKGCNSVVHLAMAEENLGYAGGVNAWLRPLLDTEAWPAVWVLNPDTQPAPDALAELATYAAKWQKGMVGCRLVPTGSLDLVHSRGLAWCKPRATARSVDLRSSGDFEPDPEQVDARLDAPSGASMYVTRACIDQIGLMDEDYFLYFEDLEWGLRAKREFGVGYAHRSVVVHAGGTTIGSSIRAEQQSPLSLYLECRNSILFVRKNFPLWVPWTVVLQLVRTALNARAYSRGSLSAALKGIIAGIAGESGRPDPFVRAHHASVAGRP